MAEEVLILMKVPGIDGTSRLRSATPDEEHVDWIPVDGCDFGLQRPVKTIEKDAKPPSEEEREIRPSFEPITLSRTIDEVTPQLMTWLVARDVREMVKIDHCNAQGQHFMRIELEGVQLVSLTIGFRAPNTFTETAKLTYNRITVHQRTFDEMGNLTTRGHSTSYQVVTEEK